MFRHEIIRSAVGAIHRSPLQQSPSHEGPFRLFVVCLFVILSHAAVVFAEPIKAFGPEILVSDIICDCPPPLCEIAVTTSPLPGRTKTVDRHDVEVAVRKAGLDPSGLTMAMRVAVTRPSSVADASSLKRKIENAISVALPHGVVLDEVGTVASVEVPKAGFEVSAMLPDDFVFHRRVSVPVNFTSNGVKFRTEQVSALLALETELPTASRDLNVGEIVGDKDILLKKVRLESETSTLAVGTADIIGRQVSELIVSGAPFETKSLRRIPVVKEGERLTLESVFGLVRVAALGVSRQDGAVGDRVRVILLSDSRLIWAQISGPGRATVVP